jgi:hypothetical protein
MDAAATAMPTIVARSSCAFLRPFDAEGPADLEQSSDDEIGPSRCHKIAPDGRCASA